ncbi:hypothetical protein [Microtetraspora malaysiensis]|uniref:hypothetical protein n=1 Tax=Microtetraspora malaysiensis TaxID=161358 RepID=UPI003D89FB57
MSDPIEIPAEVLAVFRKIKAVADASVEFLEALQPPPAVLHLNLTDSATATESLSVIVRPEPVRATLNITLPAINGALSGEVSLPPLPTVPEVNMARVWLDALRPAAKTAIAIGALESLLQFAERLLGLHL